MRLIQAWVLSDYLDDVVVSHIEDVVVDDPHGVNVDRLVTQELVEPGWRGHLLHLTFIEPLGKLAPKGVQHQFGDRFTTRVLLDLGRVRADTFAGQVIGHLPIPSMTGGPSTGIGLNFQPRVYVVGKKTFLTPSEIPDHANADDLVTHSHHLPDLHGASCLHDLHDTSCIRSLSFYETSFLKSPLGAWSRRDSGLAP